MKMNWLTLVAVGVVILFFLIGAGCLVQDKPGVTRNISVLRHEIMEQHLQNVTVSIQHSLIGLDTNMSETAVSLGRYGISGPDADSLLKGATASHPAILTMITYDGNGTVRAAEPENAKILLGQNLSDQDVVRVALSTKKPMMSDLFPLAQGGTGMSVAYPVYSPEGTFLGVASMVYVPYNLITPIVEHEINRTPYSFQVLQVGARILYDPDPGEVGRETFNETLYAKFPEIARVAGRMAENRTGYDTYSFYSTGFGRVVGKETFWSTVSLHNTEWRVMIIGEL